MRDPIPTCKSSFSKDTVNSNYKIHDRNKRRFWEHADDKREMTPALTEITVQ